MACDASCCDHTGAQEWTATLPLLSPLPLACVGLEPGCMLMLSCAANGQQDNKKIDELIIHYPICSARAEVDLVAQPYRLVPQIQHAGESEPHAT